MHRGYIKLYRRFLESEDWTKEKFSRGQAWVDLLGLANHKPGYIRVRGIRIEVARGQVGWSEVALSKRWRWSRERLRNWLRELEEIEQQIRQQKNRVCSLITIVNYDLYQSNQTTNQTEDRQQTGQQTDSRPDTNKNDKNDKNKRIYIQPRLGTFQNVKLTQEDLEKLQTKFYDFEQRIERLSKYIASKGDKYKSHYATILNWAE